MRLRTLALLIALAVSIGGCGSDASTVPASTADAAAAPGASGGDPRCPDARARFPARPEIVARVVRRSLPDVFSGVDTRHFHIDLVGALATAAFAPGYNKRPYTRVAARRCGRETARRSWIVVVQLPFAPDASFVPAIVYVAYTGDGWEPWYLWYPNKDKRGAFPG